LSKSGPAAEAAVQLGVAVQLGAALQFEVALQYVGERSLEREQQL
jgi:hypothetical protein